MRSDVKMVTLMLGLQAFLSAAASVALAQDQSQPDPTCNSQLESLSKEFTATGLGIPPKPSGGVVQGEKKHRHSSAEVTVMRNQLRLANHLCKEGKEHEAMLRMDVVRAMLKLPEIQHSVEHSYTKTSP